MRTKQSKKKEERECGSKLDHTNKECGSKLDHVGTHNNESLLFNQGSKLDHGWTQQTLRVGNPNPGSKLDQDGFLTGNCSQLDSTGYQVRFGDNGSEFGINKSELVPCLKPSLYKQRHPPLPPCMGHRTSQPPFSCPYNDDAVNSMYKKKYEEMIYVQKEKKGRPTQKGICEGKERGI